MGGVVRIARIMVETACTIAAVVLAGTVLFGVTIPVGAAVASLGPSPFLLWLAGCYVAAAAILTWWTWADTRPARASRWIHRLRPSRRWIGILAAGRRRMRRGSVITIEFWSQPWPCPHRDGFRLSRSPFRSPTAEMVRRAATCRRCGAHLFEDGRIPVPAQYRPAAERDAEPG